MSMTKTDYELIANSIRSVLHDCGSDTESDTVCEVAMALAVDFKDNNPKFNRNKFLLACGIEQDN